MEYADRRIFREAERSNSGFRYGVNDSPFGTSKLGQLGATARAQVKQSDSATNTLMSCLSGGDGDRCVEIESAEFAGRVPTTAAHLRV
jgi:hypothetical protein